MTLCRSLSWCTCPRQLSSTPRTGAHSLSCDYPTNPELSIEPAAPPPSDYEVDGITGTAPAPDDYEVDGITGTAPAPDDYEVDGITGIAPTSSYSELDHLTATTPAPPVGNGFAPDPDGDDVPPVSSSATAAAAALHLADSAGVEHSPAITTDDVFQLAARTPTANFKHNTAAGTNFHFTIHGRAVQVDPIRPVLKAPGTVRSKLKYGNPLSSFAFKSNLRRYTMAVTGSPRRTLTTPPGYQPCTRHHPPLRPYSRSLDTLFWSRLLPLQRLL